MFHTGVDNVALSGGNRFGSTGAGEPDLNASLDNDHHRLVGTEVFRHKRGTCARSLYDRMIRAFVNVGNRGPWEGPRSVVGARRIVSHG